MRGVDGSSTVLAQRIRRLARVLVADRSEADALALAVIESLPPRASLVRAFALLVRRSREREDDAPAAIPGTRDAAAVMAGMPLHLREVLGLVAVENLTYADAGWVLDLDELHLMDLLTRARQELADRIEASRPVVLRLVKG